MDENETIKDIKRRLGLLESAIFSKPAGALPEERFKEKKKRAKKAIKPEKIQGYISQNDVSKSELVLLAKSLGIKVSSLLSKAELIDIVLGGEHTNEDPLQEIRDRTERFIQENNIALSTMKCDLKCQTCIEPRVVLCNLYNNETLTRYFDDER